MKEFITYKNWVQLNEQKKEEKIYGCIMLEAYINDWEDIHLNGIEKKDLYDNKDNEYGLEETPHVTLVYGIHEDEIDASVIRDTIKENIESFSVKVKNIGFFECDEYDVVKYDVIPSKDLLKYRKLFLKTFENTQTFKEYHPHITLAYVKKGEAKKYAKKLEEPFEIEFIRGVYSYHKNINGEIEKKRSVVRLKKDTDGEEANLNHA